MLLAPLWLGAVMTSKINEHWGVEVGLCRGGTRRHRAGCAGYRKQRIRLSESVGDAYKMDSEKRKSFSGGADKQKFRADGKIRKQPWRKWRMEGTPN